MSESTAPETKGRRQVVKFSFYHVDPAWRGLPDAERDRGKREFLAALDSFSDRLQIRVYSVVGMRGDADFLLWQIGDNLDDIQTARGGHQRLFDGRAPLDAVLVPGDDTTLAFIVSGDEARRGLDLHPTDSKYFFVYPFVKTRDWYQLSAGRAAER